ncbi:hypothetical protein E6P09_16590 (plasmid) [Haloferax mediterranei ATCC 33500]|uniref:Uncharacterized protein n=1 Tax=Haloferax mediterranei (strain ATCC 33500 / DSM 1411 / JCM 8866 / NBRC 14739 / NCIMB 2177 / R-4) TaxID=523841 RepID=I3RAX6_HALMT|nr:hypothetical protein [Haloferax mediterranei]AFK21386.1 hypothetical protein HFX_6263 [Haloferax mediterranei ATCC 33500]AHZ24541.1 hypothetical protein BM92_16670 [Haloferax mediterranei ATCC 33500]MDX5990406.1 hypothetical protein [Haloferax mediterranei ATCC 33500]QCQ76937.1 hypothetical protein E6P09_16590 [Haloferax mediterranei ATCC 33500]
MSLRGRFRGSGENRGQTNIDFVLGIVVFLFAFSFVIAAMPQLLAPYDDQETPLVAERVSSTLADSLLVAEGDPGFLSVECTGAFFVGTGGSGCPFSTSDPLSDQVGVDQTYQVNATLQWNVSGDADTEVLCYNGGDVGACGSDPLTVGPAVPQEQRSVAVERRTVMVDDQPAILEVRVW